MASQSQEKGTLWKWYAQFFSNWLSKWLQRAIKKNCSHPRCPKKMLDDDTIGERMLGNKFYTPSPWVFSDIYNRPRQLLAVVKPPRAPSSLLTIWILGILIAMQLLSSAFEHHSNRRQFLFFILNLFFAISCWIDGRMFYIVHIWIKSAL